MDTCTHLSIEVKTLVCGKRNRNQPAVRITLTKLFTPLREGEKHGVFSRLGVHGDFVGVGHLPVGPIDENIVSSGRSGRIGCRGHMSPFSVEGRPPDSPMSESTILHSDSSVKRKTPSGKK